VPPAPEPFDPVPLLVALAHGDVDFVVIGGFAGGAHGSAYSTGDLDVAYRTLSDAIRAPKPDS
jgi:hypothetical protein